MPLVVAGLGLVSPAGTTVAHHAFLLRAGAMPTWPSPFVGADGEPIVVRYCPWIGAHASYAARIQDMATTAIDAARAEPCDAIFCWSDAGEWTDAERDQVEGELARRAGAKATLRVSSFCQALDAARDRLASGARAAIVVTADSLVRPKSAQSLSPPWARAEPPPSEGAAALLLTGSTREALATIDGWAGVLGASHDDNQAIVDGVAMSQALRQLPPAAPIQAVFGQLLVDPLRETEWLCALPRNARLFVPTHASYCLEDEIGRVGAAAGLMNLAYGLAVLHHRATPRPETSTLLSWAITRTGLRAACLAHLTS